MADAWPPTLAETKTHLRIPSGQTVDDPALQGFIDAAVNLVEYIVGPVTSGSVTEWHDGGKGTHWQITLRQRPVAAITSVTGYIGNTAQVFTQAADPSAATS